MFECRRVENYRRAELILMISFVVENLCEMWTFEI